MTLWNHRQASDIIRHSSFGLNFGTESQSRAEALEQMTDKCGHLVDMLHFLNSTAALEF